jgi:lipopolysaccharide export system protein LptA
VSKYVLSLFLLLTAAMAMGQKKSIVKLIKSASSTGLKRGGKDVIKVYQGTFVQDYSTLTSDSAYFYPQDNAFDAYSHVHIQQGDTLNIYSDLLNYNGNTKVAILTNNVKMVDKDATLTTNHLNYNTATRIGTYTDGGKLVNKDNTLLSKNGYYFAFSRDSYFRYNVSLITPDALVKTDTMRYNTGSKIAYFYGPTNIYSTKGEKDKDTLYTENGTYNTVNEQAAFGKNNLYRSGTKSLKGDSLFYDKIKGYGRAVKHVTFNDKEQKVTIKGDLGTYFKPEERTIVTQDPYIIMVTEQKDTTKTDSAAKVDSVVKKVPSQKKNGISMVQVIKNTIPVNIDSLTHNKKGLQAKADSATKKLPAQQKNGIIMAQVIKNTIPVNMDSLAANKTKLQAKADSAIKQIAPVIKTTIEKNKDKLNPKLVSKEKEIIKDKVPGKLTSAKDTGKMKIDSIYMSADTIETQILTYKNLKIYQEKQRLAHVRDTSAKPKPQKPKVKEKPSKFLTAMQIGIPPMDTSFYHKDFFGKPKPVVVKKKPVKPLSKKQLALDSLRKKQEADSTLAAKLAEPSDTARIRIIMTYHHAKLFKSDLQAKSDSMFYSASDSTIRCYVNPIIWTEGSQLSGDTVHLQMKHKKLDNMTMFPSAFIVNIEKDDSTHFNQVGGKRMRGFFKDDKLNRMFIEGNAESIYFSRDSGKMTISGMERSLSSRIRVDFKDNKATNLAFYTKPQHTYGPLDKFKEDERILKGFIWKPKERPVSKESIIPSYNKKAAAVKAPSDKASKGKQPLKKLANGKTVKDSTVTAPPSKLPALKTGKDSTVTPLPGKLPGLKTGKDSTLKTDTTKEKITIDTSKAKVIKAGKDSVKKN